VVCLLLCMSILSGLCISWGVYGWRSFGMMCKTDSRFGVNTKGNPSKKTRDTPLPCECGIIVT
jgi:hypothetical protein